MLHILLARATRRAQRIDIDLLDTRALGDQVTEGDQEMFKGSKVNGWVSTYSMQSFKDADLLHQATSQRGGQRWQAKCAITVYFDKLPTGAEDRYRTELRVEAASLPQESSQSSHPSCVSSVGPEWTIKSGSVLW